MDTDINIDLRTLSAKEWILLGLQAEGLCVQRMTELADALTESDPELAARVHDIARDERDHVAQLSAFNLTTPWPTVLHINRSALLMLLQRHFPRLTAGPVGSGREAALRFVREVEDESIRFYRDLSDATPESPIGQLFAQLAAAEAGHSESFLRAAG